MTPLADLSRQLREGEATSLALTSACLDRIADPQGEGARAFLSVDRDGALAQAADLDRLGRLGQVPGDLAGLPVSIKALFDVQGWTTTAGSRLLRDAPPAGRDAEAVRRLRLAGMVLLGHTNMTEFAYSGLGMNPHYGTPGNPYDRTRIPGGSSSGAAVSVADGMAAVALGTDTGGSCRIPAAFCGLVGFKPTARRVPTAGAYPLSLTLDSIGPIGRTVACCAMVDRVLAGETSADIPPPPPSSLRFGVLRNYVMEGIETPVAQAYEAAIERLSRSGARIEEIEIPDLQALPELNARGGIVAAEALSVHRRYLEDQSEAYDPRVAVRIRKAESQRPGELAALLTERADMIARAAAITGGFDAVLMPTVPLLPPRIADLDGDEDLYGRINLLALRNPTVANVLDRCAISMPMGLADGLPTGLTLMGDAMADRRLLAVAATVEATLGAPLI